MVRTELLKLRHQTLELYQHNLVNGIHHVITAGGGAPLYDPEKANYVVKSAKEHHYCIVEINSDRFSLTAKDLDGKVIDSFEIKK